MKLQNFFKIIEGGLRGKIIRKLSNHLKKENNKINQTETVGYAPHAVFTICGLIFVSFGIWSNISSLDIVSLATGEVITSTNVKTVQHLEGGIVRKILVKEGEEVKSGQELVVLEPTSSGADVGELGVRLTSLRVEIARLEALTNGTKTPNFPEDILENYPELISEAMQRFRIQRKSQDGKIAKQRQTIQQRAHEINEINARIENGLKNLVLLKEQVAISDELLADDLTDRYTHLDLLKEKNRIHGNIKVDDSALKRAKSAHSEAKAELKNLRNSSKEEFRRELDEANINFRELSQRMQKFEDSLKRTVVRSPVEGIIKTLYVFTVGGVRKPGDAVAEIVPSGDRLIIAAKLPTQDIGYVNVGQTATLKLASADALRFGHINGNVHTVSPDALVMEDGIPYYRVWIYPEKDSFQRGTHKYNLFPGMQIMVSIHTGERTVFEYLTSPLRTSMDTALGER